MSKDLLELITSSWSAGTRKQYEPYIRKWIKFCDENRIDPTCPPIISGAEFITKLFKEGGIGYSAINTARSALSAVIDPVNGITFGKQPLIKRVLRGVFRERPALPRYTTTYDVDIVLNYLKSLGTTVTLQDLTLRLATLTCILSGQRSQTLGYLSLSSMYIDDNKCVFVVTELLKQTRPGHHQEPLEFCAFADDPAICVVANLKAYLEVTKDMRPKNDHGLFVSLSKPYHSVKSSTIAKWILNVLGKAGIDISLFKTHSVRGASTTKAHMKGLSLHDIGKAAGWSGSSTFKKFYKKPLCNNFSKTLLSNSKKQ